MVKVKKYSNRRLYDSEASTYVNLGDLAERIRAGETLEVTDASTGEDLTRQVLLQILLEAGGAERLLPVGLLHRVIRAAGDHPVQQQMIGQLASGMELLETQLAALERQFSWAKPPPPKPAPPPPPPEPDDDELDALRARLAALESRLKG